jgi:hypothetical protein
MADVAVRETGTVRHVKAPVRIAEAVDREAERLALSRSAVVRLWLGAHTRGLTESLGVELGNDISPVKQKTSHSMRGLNVPRRGQATEHTNRKLKERVKFRYQGARPHVAVTQAIRNRSQLASSAGGNRFENQACRFALRLLSQCCPYRKPHLVSASDTSVDANI